MNGTLNPVNSATEITAVQRFAANLSAVMDRDQSIPASRGRAAYLAERLSVTNTTAGMWLGGQRLPDAQHMLDLMRLLNCRFEDLMIGPDEAPMMLDETYVAIDCHDADSLDGWPFYTLPEALRGLNLPRQMRMMRLDTGEMAPFAGKGDVVVYDTRTTAIVTSGIYVLKVREHMTVRRATVDLLGTIRLTCDNPDYRDEAVFQPADFADGDTPGKIRVLGAVCARVLMSR